MKNEFQKIIQHEKFLSFLHDIERKLDIVKISYPDFSGAIEELKNILISRIEAKTRKSNLKTMRSAMRDYIESNERLEFPRG